MSLSGRLSADSISIAGVHVCDPGLLLSYLQSASVCGNVLSSGRRCKAVCESSSIGENQNVIGQLAMGYHADSKK